VVDVNRASFDNMLPPGVDYAFGRKVRQMQGKGSRHYEGQ